MLEIADPRERALSLHQFSLVINVQCNTGHEVGTLAKQDNYGIILCHIGSFSLLWTT